jgi:molybdate transport system substrate-binding protein
MNVILNFKRININSSCMKIFWHIFFLAILVLSGCGRLTGNPENPQQINVEKSSISQAIPTTNPPQPKRLTVYAAASLTDAFLEIGSEFERDHPGVKVDFSFAGSQILRTQIEQGAVADVIASADHKNMDLLVSEGLVRSNSMQDFATNTLIMILPPGNPAGIEKLQDLTKPGIRFILADASVPAGDYARQVLSNLNSAPSFGMSFSSFVLANLVSNETDVRQVVTKVELGEADAGFVYASDVMASPELITVAIPEKYNIIAHYPISTLENAVYPDLAETFIEFVMSPGGQKILSMWGFSPEK